MTSIASFLFSCSLIVFEIFCFPSLLNLLCVVLYYCKSHALLLLVYNVQVFFFFWCFVLLLSFFFVLFPLHLDLLCVIVCCVANHTFHCHDLSLLLLQPPSLCSKEVQFFFVLCFVFGVYYFRNIEFQTLNNQ